MSNRKPAFLSAQLFGGIMRVFARAVLFCTVMFSTSTVFGQVPETAENPVAQANTVPSTTPTETGTPSAAQDNATTTPKTAGDAQAAGNAQVAGDAQSTDNAQSAGEDAQDAQAQLPQSESGSAGGSPITTARLEKQIREVGTSVDTLKEDTFTTKSRLMLLREEVLQRSVSGSRIQIRHKNKMGGQYSLVQIYYAIDQQPVFVRDDSSGALNKLDDEVISDQLLSPGSHQLSVLYVYKGKPWGVFQYMNDYTFRVESGYDFTVDEGKTAELVVTAAEAGNFFTAYEKRPTVKYQYEQFDLVPDSDDKKAQKSE